MLTEVVTQYEKGMTASQGEVLFLPPDVAYPLHQWESGCQINQLASAGQSNTTPSLLPAKQSKRSIAVEHWCGSWRLQDGKG